MSPALLVCLLASAPPAITSLAGEPLSDDGGAAVAALRVTGAHLEHARFGLVGPSQSLPLTPRPDERGFFLPLPEPLLAGQARLVVTNAEGGVELELPELDGDYLMSRLNQATGLVPFAVLPSGEGADDIAAGSHAHPYAAAGHTHTEYAAAVHGHGTRYFSEPGVLDVGALRFFEPLGVWGFGDGHAHATSSAAATGRAPLRLPDGAVITKVDCAFGDAFGALLQLVARVERLPQLHAGEDTQPLPEVLFAADVEHDGVTAGVVGFELLPEVGAADAIDTALFRYHLEVEMTAAAGGASDLQRFFGCQVHHAQP